MTIKFDPDENTCAGKPIKSAMHIFSSDLLKGCKRFVELIELNNNDQDIVIFNTSCVLNAVCFLEARINEQISIAVMCFDEDEREGKSWRVIQRLQKKLTLQEKWDLIAVNTNGLLWDKGVEPFQSLDIIISLRNELVHYKGELFSENKAPNNKILQLMKKFGVTSNTTWIEDDFSIWINDLLCSKSLSKWIFNKVNNFNNSYQNRLYEKDREDQD